MRWVLMIGVLAGLGCNRSDLLDETTCAEEGRYVVVQNNAFCVYPDAAVFPCPDALPFAVQFAGAGFCAIEEAPPEALLGAALSVALDVDAGPADSGAVDGGDADGGVTADGSTTGTIDAEAP